MITLGTGELIEVILYVQEMNTQVAFYRDILGLEVKEPRGVSDFREFYQVSLQSGGCTLVLQTGGKRGIKEATPRLVFRVENIHASYYFLLQKGSEIQEVHSPQPDLLVCHGKDPEGNAFSIENRGEKVRQDKKVTRSEVQTGVLSIPIDSFRGTTIRLMRTNKFMIALEILFVIGIEVSGTLWGFVSYVSELLLIFGILWLRGTNWSELGLRRPQSWKTTLLGGLGLGLLYTVLATFFIGPLIHHFVHTYANLKVFDSVTGNWRFFITELIASWTSAAFVEEMIFRAYLMNRVADLFNRNGIGIVIALIVESVVFGSAHAYQGLAGMISAGMYGLFAGLIYFASKKNLWICSIMHGVIDSINFWRIFGNF